MHAHSDPAWSAKAPSARRRPRPVPRMASGQPARARRKRRYLGGGKLHGPVARGEGERALMRAVLVDAVRCLAGQASPLSVRPRLQLQARQWITVSDPQSPFSFENVCLGLGLEVARVRSLLLGPIETLAAVCRRLAEHVLAP